MKKIVLVTSLLLFFCSLNVFSQIEKEHKDYVPDSTTAMNIALAVWTPIYGKEFIDKHKFHYAVLDKDSKIWIVFVSLSEESFGGSIDAKIAKYDGRIISIGLGK